MLKNLIKRPIAVSMCLIAIIVISILALRFIPVSLMPDIDVPQIAVQAIYPGASVEEVEKQVTRPLRQQLLQVAGLKEMRSESRMDAGILRLTFDTGSDMDLIFIDVNEKVDRAMAFLPKEAERPKVMKTSALDIPAFYLNLSLKNEKPGEDASLRFAELGRFARDVVAKRIEQMPQTAMVDVSGTTATEIMLIPDESRMSAPGLTVADIEKALADNNITLGALSIADGIYRYNVHFDSQILDKNDIGDIYLNHHGRLLQLRDICTISEKTAGRDGMVRSDGRNAVTMAVVKQNDARMEDLQDGMEMLLSDMRNEYPDIEFSLTRDQTKLLTYSISNLETNLLLGAILACLILFLFMRDWRPTILVILTIPVSLLITLLCFYLLHISINVISLSGLILGVGMMVDNSIIVIDNIRQRLNAENKLEKAVTEGTKEVFAPMLSSVLTTCSVFIPLIFLSGVAGALFFDQAMAVAISLFASLAVSVLVIPVFYYLLYKDKYPLDKNKTGIISPSDNPKSSILHSQLPVLNSRLYERIHAHVFRHSRFYLILSLLCIPVSALMFHLLDKERMPYIAPEDALITIDWNSGISAAENDRRMMQLIEAGNEKIEASTVMAGVQEFLLGHTKDLTSSESVAYVRCADAGALHDVEETFRQWLSAYYPNADMEISSSGNVYDLVFDTGVSDLEIHLQTSDGLRPTVAQSRMYIDSLHSAFPDVYLQPVVTEENIQYRADIEKMTLYKVTYRSLYQHLREAVHQNRIYEINDGSRSIPVMVGSRGEEGGDSKESDMILSGSIRNSEGTDIPLSLILRQVKTEDYKRLAASGTGEYYPVGVNASNSQVREIMAYTEAFVDRHPEFSATFEGEYFKSRKLVGELAVIMAVALALLYFILAAQFESLVQPFIILFEMAIDICVVFIVLWLCGETLNIMSMTGLIVMSGIIINDSILKVDTINRLRRSGMPLLKAVNEAGRKRLRPILMTSLTTILALLPFLHRGDIGSSLQYPLSLTLVVGMTIGTLVSIFIVPMLYYQIYRVSEESGSLKSSGSLWSLKKDSHGSED